MIPGNASLCRQIPQSSQLRDVEWASNTCTLTFNTIGIWPEGADGTDVNHCDRSHDMRLMATADDFGKVKLYSYPVMQPKVSIATASYISFSPAAILNSLSFVDSNSSDLYIFHS